MNINVTADASGAAAAARQGHVVVIVDVISMSTSLESALDAGAISVWGASLDVSRAPVDLDPQNIGRIVGASALEQKCKVIVLSEPRFGSESERRKNAGKLLQGLKQAGTEPAMILPNAGAEVSRLTDLSGSIVVAVTDCGGAAFDAAYTAGAPAVLTGTVARTQKQKGSEPAISAALRAMAEAERLHTSISVVAASSNAAEDIMAAERVAEEIYRLGAARR